MSVLESPIYWIAPTLFLVIALAKLFVEELIALVRLCKKLKATFRSEYSLKTGKLEPRERMSSQNKRLLL